MKWEGQRESDNVEDRRGMEGGSGAPLIGGRHIGIGGIAVALLASWFLGINPMTALNIVSGLSGGSSSNPSPAPVRSATKAPTDAPARFVRTVLADTEDVWGEVFAASNKRYPAPTLVLFSGQTSTGYGTGESAMGPFYCPGDRKVYIDLSFYDTLRSRLGAPGDFAQAYVVAHEVGHHLQNLLGISAKLDAARSRVSKREYNALSVRLELQADCFAGVWANHSQRSKGWLEQGDIEEALNAASQIGDDTLQRASGGQVVPESFTHGSSEQRVRWFKQGLQTGELKACDTFAARQL